MRAWQILTEFIQYTILIMSFSYRYVNKKNIFIALVFLTVILNFSIYNGIHIDILYKCKNKSIKVNDIYPESDFINPVNKSVKRSSLDLVLENNFFSILKNNKVLWKTENEYKVKDFLYCDIDKDNKDEIMLLLWKKSKFGKNKPFFAYDDKNKWTQHIFIYDFDGNKIKPIWFSSYISVTVKDFYYDEDLQILNILDTDNGRTRFKWQTWGLTGINSSKLDYDKSHDTIIEELNINAFGDNLIHNQIYEYGIEENNKSFDFLYENIKKELSVDKNTLNSINQETMFVEEYDKYSSYPSFGSPIEVGDAIINAGFNLITLANNHSLDREYKGVFTTYNYYNNLWKERNTIKEEFKNREINHIGIVDKENYKVPYKIINKGKLKISIFNYTYNVNKNEYTDFSKELPFVNDLRNERQVIRDLEEGVRKSDISIVYVHWGTEYNLEIDNFQKKWAKAFLQCGVDVVIGTHPHVLQKYEVLKDKDGHEMLIYYSLGNLVSFQKGMDRILGGEAKIKMALTNHGVKFINYDLKKLITHKQNKYVTVYLLDDYTLDLAKKHNDRWDIMRILEKETNMISKLD